MNQDPASTPAESAPAPLAPEAFDEIDAILDDLRSRYDETPQWEFCEGFMAALICCRRAIPTEEYLDVLLAIAPEGERITSDGGEGAFADAAQKERFLHLWNQRWAEVAQALDTPVQSLDEEGVYQPEVMDVRGAVAALPEAERPDLDGEALPAFGQVWALGFMYAVEAWPEEWAPPRDKDAAKWLDASLQAIVAMTEDDAGEPEVSPFDDDGAPTMSVARLNAFADAVWAVYDLREIWRGIGPRVETVHRADTPGRNDLCPCGSGKKFKKCHGA
ncbi:MAG: UPF0149 family protein [Rhodoferax sp.]